RVVTCGRRAEGIGDLHVTVDLSSPGEPKRLIAETIDRFGRVDCLVNNVGGTDIRELEELVDEDWQTSFELNLMSAIRATQAALPGMRERQSGVIVSVSSSAGKRPSARMPDYSVLKASLVGRRRHCPDHHLTRPLPWADAGRRRTGRRRLRRAHARGRRARALAARRPLLRNAGPRARRGGVLRAHPVPARPRSHPALEA